MARYRRQYHGAVYLISKGSLSTIINLNFNLGDILFCVSMVAWAFYTILVAQVSKYVSAYSAVAWAGLLGSLTTAAYSILTGQFALPYDLSALAWGSYFYVIFIGSLVGMLFWNKGIRVIGPSQAAVFMNLMPLVGIICGIAGIDEDGKAITPYVNYLDSRTRDDVEALKAKKLDIGDGKRATPNRT